MQNKGHKACSHLVCVQKLPQIVRKKAKAMAFLGEPKEDVLLR